MLLSPTNIKEKLKKEQKKAFTTTEILDQVKSILNDYSSQEASIKNNLKESESINANAFNFELLETENIFHINAIKNTCIDYRLRFLDTKYFKSDYPQDAINKIKALEKAHNTTIKGFKIMAPSKLFKLENPDDPLLFAPIGNDYYYLIHKWGNDLNPLRKLRVLPFKTYENLLVFALIVSFTLTFLFNSNLPKEQFNSYFFLLFLFMFKSVIGVVIFYAISQGKNVNSAIWNNKYNK
ncbi:MULTISPECIES: hypothetical protein [Mesoflavibacter]|uniref:Uncharacterized protein n=1 Tax=Mesoflavibacter profundi TaxID=2708110 RepID=A0ABT4RWP4_9FLAO|nr:MULTISPECIES: hypothetical protein [Mesoflavibacter]MDA0176246.1 hypothetical protein [Mesoflavibacter profundi]QIJ89882.1 hypothetical protein C7H62_2074 [Mesoflavibacter sp. HG96]QIJ92610.1 hypothetical protein C7H56_2074 [Mesoflavibacter sp. HG37]